MRDCDFFDVVSVRMVVAMLTVMPLVAWRGVLVLGERIYASPLEKPY
jgi:hypothetical protein